jgi:hypothetical protein
VALGSAAPDLPRSLFGIPVIVSDNSPLQVTLLDAANILYSDDGAIDIDTSEQASIQFDDAPVNPAVAATVFRNLWQNDLWGIRVTHWLAYLRAQTGSVAYMVTAY